MSICNSCKYICYCSKVILTGDVCPEEFKKEAIECYNRRRKETVENKTIK